MPAAELTGAAVQLKVATLLSRTAPRCHFGDRGERQSLAVPGAPRLPQISLTALLWGVFSVLQSPRADHGCCLFEGCSCSPHCPVAFGTLSQKPSEVFWSSMSSSLCPSLPPCGALRAPPAPP